MQNQIHLNGLQSGHNTLTIFEGKALEQKPPTKLTLSGDIHSVTRFLDKRTEPFYGSGLQTVDPTTTVIVVDVDNMTIHLSLNPTDPYGTEVMARLEHTEEFLQWKINQPVQFTREQLVKLLRFNKRLFDSADKHDEVLKAYMSLQVSAQTEVKAASDTRGNKNNLFNKSVDSQNIPTEFVLNLQVFKGMSLERFRVEICLDVTDGSTRFWFESPELVELIDRRKKEIFGALTERFSQYAVIYK